MAPVRCSAASPAGTPESARPGPRAGTDGRDMPLEVAASTYRRDGELLDIFVLRDVSERRRGEAERAELQARLAQSLRMEALVVTHSDSR